MDGSNMRGGIGPLLHNIVIISGVDCPEIIKGGTYSAVLTLPLISTMFVNGFPYVGKNKTEHWPTQA
jgi:hypothetical protein